MVIFWEKISQPRDLGSVTHVCKGSHSDISFHLLLVFWYSDYSRKFLRVTAVSRWSLGPREAVSSLVGSRCTTKVGSIGDASETITILGFLKPPNGLSWLLLSFIIIYKVFVSFTHTYVYETLILASKLRAPKIDKTMSKLL